MKIEISTKTIIKTIIILLSLGFLFLVRDIILLLFISIIIAASMEPAVNFLQKKKIPRIFGTALIYLVLFSVFALVVSFLIPPMVDQFQDFSQNTSKYFSETKNPLGSFSMIQPEGAIISIQNIINSLSEDISNIHKSIFSKTIGVFSGMLSVVVVFSMAFYMVMEEDGIKKAFVFIVPEKNKKYAADLTDRIKDKIGKWMIGQLFLMVFIFFFVFVGLSIIDIPYALILAIFAGILEIIPYVGPIIFSVPGIILGFLISPTTGFLAILVYLVSQQVESHIVVPQVMKKAVGLNPVVTIVVILIGFKLAGVLGAIVAVPLATAISLFVMDFAKSN